MTRTQWNYGCVMLAAFLATASHNAAPWLLMLLMR